MKARLTLEGVHMDTTQVEPQTRDAHDILHTLPVQHPSPAKSVMDFVAEEPEDGVTLGQSAVLRNFVTGLSWAMGALLLGMVVWMTYSAGREYMLP